MLIFWDARKVVVNKCGCCDSEPDNAMVNYAPTDTDVSEILSGGTGLAAEADVACMLLRHLEQAIHNKENKIEMQKAFQRYAEDYHCPAIKKTNVEQLNNE